MTGLQIARRALRTIGAIYPGQSLTDQEFKDVMEVLQTMLDAWATQRLSIYTIEEATETLVAGQQTYTIGPGGFFARQRPIWIYGISCISTNNPTQPLELPVEMLTTQKWQAIPTKNVHSSLFTGAYYDRAFTGLGVGAIHTWPIVNVGNVRMKLYLPTAISKFPASPSQDYILPPGYEEAIVYNLAVRLAPEWGQSIDPIVHHMASESFANIKRANIILEDLLCDSALLWQTNGLYNYKTDQNV